MNRIEVKKLKLGLYKIYWKNGDTSLAAVGMTESGSKWLAPTNWVFPASVFKQTWFHVKKAVIINYII